MATIYVSKSGNNSNNGSTYALSKLTIQAGLTAAGSGGTLIIGSGLYNEQASLSGAITIYADGIVVMDGTGLASTSPLLTLTLSSSSTTVSMLPYTNGGAFVFQNCINLSVTAMVLNLSGGTGNNQIYILQNVIFRNNISTYTIYHTASGNVYSGGMLTMTNCLIAGNPTNNPNGIYKAGTTNPSIVSLAYCTFYNLSAAISSSNNSTIPITLSSNLFNIFSNVTTPYNVTTVTTSNQNQYYNATNWVVGATTYSSFATLQAAGYDANSIVADPQFVDPTNNVFYRKTQSAVSNNIGMYPYGLARGYGYNPDSQWQVTASADNTGWYSADGGVVKDGTTGYFELVNATSSLLYSPVWDTGIVGCKPKNIHLAVNQTWPTNMIDTTKTDTMPNYQTVEVRASDTVFAQNAGIPAWTEVHTETAFSGLGGAAPVSGRFLQVRLCFRADDLAG